MRCLYSRLFRILVQGSLGCMFVRKTLPGPPLFRLTLGVLLEIRNILEIVHHACETVVQTVLSMILSSLIFCLVLCIKCLRASDTFAASPELAPESSLLISLQKFPPATPYSTAWARSVARGLCTLLNSSPHCYHKRSRVLV